MSGAAVAFTAACPSCGIDCTWHQTATASYSAGGVEVDSETEIRCGCPTEEAA